MMHHFHPKAIRCAAARHDKSLENATIAEHTSRTALVLGGGAPNSALMAGALAAFNDQGVTFDVVSTSGAGGLIGLLWLAPRDKTPAAALRDWVDSYVDDAIYRWFPVDYKVFFKPGWAADLYRTGLNAIPAYRAVTAEAGDSPAQRLVSDWVQLITATLAPSSLDAASPGLCARVPWADQIIDFSRIKSIKPFFYLNAYNITHGIMDDFAKNEITLDHFKAAFAFPYIYGPYRVGDCDYYEGASHESLNFQDLVEKHPGIETIVVFDVLGTNSLIRAPRDLYDSWVLSMIIPLVKVAEDNLNIFAAKYNHGWRRAEGAKADLLVVPFDVPEADLEKVLDWSYSNGKRLFNVGYRSALDFLLNDGKTLLKSRPETVTTS
ncbi:MAG: patatin-like phospholipase family protein [Azospirillaceae bacterium]|nr:patatin-like phospholipase family protein [Azospirillaceae bacterium]